MRQKNQRKYQRITKRCNKHKIVTISHLNVYVFQQNGEDNNFVDDDEEDEPTDEVDREDELRELFHN